MLRHESKSHRKQSQACHFARHAFSHFSNLTSLFPSMLTLLLPWPSIWSNHCKKLSPSSLDPLPGLLQSDISKMLIWWYYSPEWSSHLSDSSCTHHSKSFPRVPLVLYSIEVLVDQQIHSVISDINQDNQILQDLNILWLPSKVPFLLIYRFQ